MNTTQNNRLLAEFLGYEVVTVQVYNECVEFVKWYNNLKL